jgi:chemotaxis protein MotB
MTYADMITLLLCFFVLFASISVSQKKSAQGIQVTQEEEKPQNPAPTESREQTSYSETAEKAPQPESQPTPVENLKPPVSADPDQMGDRIISFEISSAAFFDSGSAMLTPAGKALLQDVAAKLESEKYQGYGITVEGHTDDAPISTSLFPSNWELSTARAAAVVRFFLDAGLSAHRLRAAGYADTFPKLPNRDANGAVIPENQAQNRRVVIKLEKIEKQGADF